MITRRLAAILGRGRTRRRDTVGRSGGPAVWIRGQPTRWNDRYRENPHVTAVVSRCGGAAGHRLGVPGRRPDRPAASPRERDRFVDDRLRLVWLTSLAFVAPLVQWHEIGVALALYWVLFVILLTYPHGRPTRVERWVIEVWGLFVLGVATAIAAFNDFYATIDGPPATGRTGRGRSRSRPSKGQATNPPTPWCRTVPWCLREARTSTTGCCGDPTTARRDGRGVGRSARAPGLCTRGPTPGSSWRRITAGLPVAPLT